MRRILFLTAFIVFSGCTNETDLDENTKHFREKSLNTITFSKSRLDMKSQNSLDDSSIKLTDGKSSILLRTETSFNNTTTYNNEFFGFSVCFQGNQEEILDCLQNYVGATNIIYQFDPSIPDNPESVVIDSNGDFIISMALSGQIVKITRSGTRELIATLPIGNFIPGQFTGLMGAITIDKRDNIYVNVNAENPSLRGVWKVSKNGNTSLLANLPTNAVPNGIVLIDKNLYIADSGFDGKVWCVSTKNGETEIWADDPLLKLINFGVMKPGPNGIQYYEGEIYVSNPNQDLLLAIGLNPNGSSGDIRIISNDVAFDDFAIDILGNVIGTTDPFNTIEKIYPDGTKQILLTVEDGLDGPTAATFGKTFEDSFNLYITNAAFPFFTETFMPSLMKLELGIPGYKY